MTLTDAIEETIKMLENAIEATSDAEEEQSKGKKSLRSAINAHCRSCGYDSLDKGAGNWRQQIQACPVITCELYEVRPISKPKKPVKLPFIT